MKKIFAVSISILLIVMSLSCLAVEAEDVTDSGEADTDITAPADVSGVLENGISWSYYSQNGRLEIKGVGEIPDYEDVKAPWKAECSAATSLVVGEGITRIGEDAFSDMLSLSAITLPYSLVSVGEEAFYNTYYYNYTENRKGGVLYIGSCLIDADESVARSYTVKDGTRCIADGAFEDLDGVYSITLPEGVTHIGESAFEDCETLKLLYLPSTLKYIGANATESCEKLEKVTFSGTADAWAKVSVTGGNSNLRSASKNFVPLSESSSGDETTATPGSGKLPILGGCSSIGIAAFAAAIISSIIAAVVVIKKK